MPEVIKTPEQLKALEDLSSKLENLQHGHHWDESLIFSGDSVDGPVLGWIDTDGTIDFMVGGIPDGDS